MDIKRAQNFYHKNSLEFKDQKKFGPQLEACDRTEPFWIIIL